MSRRVPTRDLTESSEDHAPFPLDIGGGVSPWASPLKREKEWHSPSRKKADDCWLEEHVERNSDLQTIRESLSAYAISDHASTATPSPTHRARGVYIYEHDDNRQQHERDGPFGHLRRREVTDRPLQLEMRSVPEHRHRSTSRTVHRRHRYDSQESFESARSSRSSRKYKPAPTAYTAYDHLEAYDSGYGSYGSRGSHGHEVAKTEPYAYSPIPRTVSMESPSTASYGIYPTAFGVGGIDIVSRAPLYAYNTRRH
ncbi:hypothetical protein A1O1_06764 [Capronia coronata CBS 617.96]|uniref:Uncharacterized protein n=1 Tax=Capronia coronata CBS 617.96 TaxID=1182541 RepID=W9Y0I7_9EURO|nr:uncharacterized protein A1O1_06764 [Capronia coronata CBS 617.96]EXJ83145.1 hypothetical protein A1O1_06764 [Capronia coronata CBS 617.96]